MLKRFHIYNARYRFERANEEAMAYQRGDNWHVTVQTALNIRRDRAAQTLAAALLS